MKILVENFRYAFIYVMYIWLNVNLRPILTLREYCTTVNRYELIQKFDACSNLIDKNDQNISRHKLINILDGIESSQNLNTANLFINILGLSELTANNFPFKNCFNNNKDCVLFNACEFPVNLNKERMSGITKSAARISSLMTAFSINEKRDKKVYLTKSNIKALLNLLLLDNTNIFDGKIIIKEIKNRQQKYLGIHAEKNIFTKNEVKIQSNYKLDFTKVIQWYNHWESASLIKKSFFNSNEIYPRIEAFQSMQYLSGIKFDCEKSLWKQIVSMPFLYANGDIRGVIALSISLNNFDLDQCGLQQASNSNETTAYNYNNKNNINKDSPFYNTDKCDRETTRCVNLPNKGFILDEYNCECKPGFYTFTNNSKKSFSCIKCSPGCRTCVDASPCEIETPYKLRQICLFVNLGCIAICLILFVYFCVQMSRNSSLLKTSSPEMLIMVLLGAILAYCEIIPMYFTPNYWTCTAAQILQLLGFLLAYGALVIKTWRECKLFYVRSIKTKKITERSLMKRLGILMLIGALFLIAWALRRTDSPHEIELTDINGLKYLSCTITEWNYISLIIQLAVLSYGVVQAIHVRRASIAFKETKLITWAIFNECFFKLVIISTTFFVLQNLDIKLWVYVPLIYTFARIHLTITIMLLLIFVYKIYTIVVSRKKPYQSTQSALLNNFTITPTDGEAKNSSICEEKEQTEKEKDLRIEIQRLCRQLEETRSLSMRIANPHLLTKKSRFINYPTKKTKSKYLLPLPLDSAEISKTEVSQNDPSCNLLNNNNDNRLKSVDEETEKVKS